MPDRGTETLSEEQLQAWARQAATGEPLAADAAGTLTAELARLRARLEAAADQVLSSEMLLDCRIAAELLLDEKQGALVDPAEQGRIVARNQLAVLDELERVRFLLSGEDAT